jgi:L-rhamnonate dehydratase
LTEKMQMSFSQWPAEARDLRKQQRPSSLQDLLRDSKRSATTYIEEAMKIVDVKTRYLRLPVVSLNGDNLQDLLIVEVHTDAGIVGIGEVHTNPLAARAIIDAIGYHTSSRGIKEVLLGENPLEIGRLWDKMYSLTQSYGRRGLLINVISGIDIALWDILGKALNQPISALLAGGRRTEVAAYASDLTPPTIEETVDLLQKHVGNGFRAVKIGWGKLGADIHHDLERVARVRRSLGTSVDIMVDLGMPIKLGDAIWLGNAMAEHDVFFLEEPLSPDDFTGWKHLIDRSPTAIATGEKETTRYGFEDLMDRGGLRIIQPDIARAGGITECVRIAALAEIRGVQVIPHCWSSDILVAATLHFISSLSDCPYLEFNVMEQPLRTMLCVDPIRPIDGVVAVPKGPGLGIELNEDVVRRYEV